MRLILGSQSPRRKEILSFFNFPFIQIASSFDELSIPFQQDPIAYVQRLSSAKADDLSKKFPDDCILTADTIVFFEGEVFNKPNNREEAFFMLKALSGNPHQVFTALSLYYQGNILTRHEETKIYFHPLSDDEIALYHSHDPCLDKAGAYAIQGTGGLLVKKIEGCYYNVMGLPVRLLQELLSVAGINLWHHLKKASDSI